jgi:hypothetical protein
LSNVEWCGPKVPLVDDDPAVLLEHRTDLALAIAGCRAKLELAEPPREQRSSRAYKSDEGDYMLAVPGAVTDAADARLVLAPVTKRPDPVLSPTAPWELATLNGNPHAVLGDDGATVQLYYSAQTTCKVEPGIPTGHCPSPLWLERWQRAHGYPAYLNLSDHEMRLLATSADGIAFTSKPIGRFPAFNDFSPQALSSGGIANNVVLPFKTKISKIAAKRFAALGMQGDCGYNGLADGRPDWKHCGGTLQQSSDGVAFGEPRPVAAPSLSNLTYDFVPDVFHQSGAGSAVYGLTRDPRFYPKDVLIRIESNENLMVWDNITDVSILPTWDQVHTQSYDMLAWPVRNGYMGFLFLRNLTSDRVCTELLSSADALHWKRIAPGVPFIPFGDAGSWDADIIFSSSPVRPAGASDERIYYSGGRGKHSGWRNDSFGLATARAGTWAGYTSGNSGSVVTIAPLRISWPASSIAPRLLLTFAGGDVGSEVRVRVLAAGGDGGSLELATGSVGSEAMGRAGAQAQYRCAVELDWHSTDEEQVTLEFTLTNATIYSFALKTDDAESLALKLLSVHFANPAAPVLPPNRLSSFDSAVCWCA